MIDRFITLSEEDVISRVLRKLARDESNKTKPPTPLTDSELDALTEVRSLLKPLATVTTQLSAEKNVTVSMVIPLISGLREKVDQVVVTNGISFNLKHSLLADLKKQFGMLDTAKIFATATLLDPRFKKHGFKNPAALARAMSTAGELISAKIAEKASLASQPGETPGSVNQNLAPVEEDDIWSTLDRSVALESALTARASSQEIGLPLELMQYLNQPAVERKTNPNPLVPLQTVQYACPNLYEVATESICMLSTSVPSERLFSHAGLILNQQRSRLSSNHLQELLFLSSVDESLWFA